MEHTKECYKCSFRVENHCTLFDTETEEYNNCVNQALLAMIIEESLEILAVKIDAKHNSKMTNKLEELVIEAAAKMTTDVNKAGPIEQIRFMYYQLGPDQTLELIKKVTEEGKETH